MEKTKISTLQNLIKKRIFLKKNKIKSQSAKN